MYTVKIENKQYDLRKFKNNHPGGEKFIALFSNQDATNAFQSYHGRHFPHNQMKKYLIKTDTSDISNIDKEYLYLHKRVKLMLLKYHKTDGYAPISQWVKIITLFLGTVLFEAKTLYSGKKGWIDSILLGFLYALIGLNIQHDANHGALSKNPYINEWVGYTQNYIGGSAMMWMYQHVVNHHQYTNIIGMDPDIDGEPILNLHNKKLKWWQTYQHYYVFLLEAFYGFVVVVGTPFELILNKQELKNQLSPSTLKWRNRELLMNVGFFIRFFLLPLIIFNETKKLILLKIASTIVVCGGYLSFFFILSHNFQNTKVYLKKNKSTSTEQFAKTQIEASSNVGGRLLSFINGGLNYQIEHHLFPRIAHYYYPDISPYVKDWCKENNIKYVHYPTIKENVLSLISYLKKTNS